MCSEQNTTITDKPLNILYQDEYLVAVHKPAGLLVHRLDKPTSGVLLFALSSEIAKLLTAQFTNHEVQKAYIAVVRGYADESGMIDYALKEELDKKSDKQARVDKPAQDAVTHYKRLNIVELNHAVRRYNTARYSLIQLEPKTGQKHQLGRHLKHIFHPIVGDTTHGDGKQNQFFRDELNCHRLLLAAVSLSLKHPVSGEELNIFAGLDDSFTRIIEALGWQGSMSVIHELGE